MMLVEIGKHLLIGLRRHHAGPSQMVPILLHARPFNRKANIYRLPFGIVVRSKMPGRLQCTNRLYRSSVAIGAQRARSLQVVAGHIDDAAEVRRSLTRPARATPKRVA